VAASWAGPGLVESARVVKSYRKRMREYAEMSYLDVWYARIDERTCSTRIRRRWESA
jgi:hypothetical protein